MGKLEKAVCGPAGDKLEAKGDLDLSKIKL